MNYSLLCETALFRGTTPGEAKEMLACLGAREREYAKGALILRAGETTDALWLVLFGGVNIESGGVWGGRSIFGHAGPGEIFAESYACALIKNLVAISAEKCLALSMRMKHTAPRTIRGRLLRYLSDQARLSGSFEFNIPYDRQQLANYLGVDRSAMSGELSKLRREGLVECRKNRFVLNGLPLEP